ncbi:MAG: hypothetical protein HKN13_08795 [Rhodothermales bacterium]|nr:hypothetical protein [Rhodothermales bacterium]
MATISVDHPEPGLLQFDVYEMLGRRKARLANSVAAAGTHRLSFDPSGLASGSYLVMATTPETGLVRPLTIVR